MKRFKRLLKFNKKKYSIILSFTIIIFLFTIGYASIGTTLTMDGVSNVSKATWNVYFDNVQIKSGSVNATTVPSISNKTEINFATKLDNPGDFYEFNVDIVNDGSIDATLDDFKVLPNLSDEQKKYLNFSVKYSYGSSINIGDNLFSGDRRNITVLVQYIDAPSEDLPAEDQQFSVNIELIYVQKSFA